MKKTTLFSILLVVSFLGTGAIGIVSLRMNISRVAKHCGELEDQREIVSREVQELRALRSRILRPSTLASMVNGRLSMPRPSRTYHVSKENLEMSLQNFRFDISKKYSSKLGKSAGIR